MCVVLCWFPVLDIRTHLPSEVLVLRSLYMKHWHNTKHNIGTSQNFKKWIDWTVTCVVCRCPMFVVGHWTHLSSEMLVLHCLHMKHWYTHRHQTLYWHMWTPVKNWKNELVERSHVWCHVGVLCGHLNTPSIRSVGVI